MLNINSLNSTPYLKHQRTFGANDGAVAMKMPEPIESITDKIDEAKEKKHNKRAIAVGGVVAGVMLMVMLFNPRYSSKLAKKLQNRQANITKKLNEAKSSNFVQKIYKFRLNAEQTISDCVNFFNNFNPYKDTIFKRFCTKEKEFARIENYRTRNKVKNANNKVLKFTTKVYNGITNAFDSISKFTVRQGYKKSLAKLDKLETFLRNKLNSLPDAEKREVEAKLAEIAEIRKHFTNENIMDRINAQEGYMANIERDFMSKFDMYKSDLTNRWIKKGDYFVKNLYYWPEEILKPSRDKVEREGLDVVEKLIGDGKEKKGLYNEIVNTVSKHLNNEEKNTLNGIYKKADKSLRTSNHNECVEYFDKKRDLVLGSAPTDIVTATVSMLAAGIAIASADDKKKRVSRLVTGVIPALGGVGVSLAMAAALVSGAKGLVVGAAASLVLNRIGIIIDKYVLGNKKEYDEENEKAHERHKQKKDNVKEVKVNA